MGSGVFNGTKPVEEFEFFWDRSGFRVPSGLAREGGGNFCRRGSVAWTGPYCAIRIRRPPWGEPGPPLCQIYKKMALRLVTASWRGGVGAWLSGAD
jgi:hypothetical protein